MSIVLKNRVHETCSSADQNYLYLGGAKNSYAAFSSVLASGDATYYTFLKQDQWEVGQGTYTPNPDKISRGSVLSSSSGAVKIDETGANQFNSSVFICYPSEKSVYKDENDKVLVDGGGVKLDTATPTDTTNTLYAVSGILYFENSVIGGANSSYTAGDGLNLNLTEFSVDDTVARSGDNVSIFSNDSGYVVLPAGGTTGQELYKVADTGVELAWKDDYSTELRETVQNDTLSDITKGTLVMSAGAAGDTIKVAPAVTDGSVEARYILGIATETITAGGGRGQVTFFGPFKGYDTSLYSVGTVLYNDPNNNGQLSSSVPTSPELSMSVAIVTKVGNSSSGRLFVRMWTQQEGLHELHDVAIDAASSGDGIKYTGTTWVPDTDIVHSGDDVSVLNNDAGYVTTDTTYTAGTGLSLDGTQFNIDETVVQSGDNISLLNNDTGYLTSHPSVSAATSSDNSGRTYIQDLFFDQHGHVTGVSTATETVVDTDTTYTAGDGLGLTGTQFSVDDTVARSGDNVSQFVNDAGYLTTDNDTTYAAGTGLSLDGTTFNIDSTVVQFSDITSGSITAGTGNIDFSVANSGDVLTQQGDGSFAMSAPAGGGGGIGGSTGGTDNAILRADGTGGGTLQSSNVTIDDSNNLTASKLSAVNFVQTTWGWFSRGTTAIMTLDPNQMRMNNVPIVGVSRLGFGTSTTLLSNEADDHLLQRRGTSPQTLSVANTYTSTTSYERLDFGWNGNVATIQTTAGSAGGTVRDLSIQNAIKIDGPDESVSELKLKVYTDATRPTPGTTGRIIYNSTDGNLNIDNGTNWILPDGTST